MLTRAAVTTLHSLSNEIREDNLFSILGIKYFMYILNNMVSKCNMQLTGNVCSTLCSFSFYSNKIA
jgi:hypothetical protein